MDQPPAPPPDPVVPQPATEGPARSFGRVADAGGWGRPSYPEEAVDWLVDGRSGRVLELGAGTGQLTEVLTGLGHDVLATDVSEAMLHRLRRRAPGTAALVATPEAIPVADRSVDVVTGAHRFHWFDTERALREIARVLRPGGRLSLVWNQRDERIPWVKRLGRLIGEEARPDHDEVVPALDGSGLFEPARTSTFRSWQPMTRASLRDLVASRSSVAVLSAGERDTVLARVEELYDEYGRGADGMLLPYLTRTFRATVLPRTTASHLAPAVGPDDLDTDSLLIDFR